MEHPKFETVVEKYYQPLYRFALSLAHSEADAADLTQETFFLWATKGRQLRDKNKVKTWLFTTLHREFLGSRRRRTRFPHHEIGYVEHELPNVTPSMANLLDGQTILEALQEVDELFRAPLSLFYIQQHSYQEIAEILDVPTGTVMSRLSRAKEQLRGILSIKARKKPSKIVPIERIAKSAES